MTLQTFIPSPALQPYIKAFLVIESDTDLVNRLLPGTSPVIALRFRGKVNHVQHDRLIELPVSVISGLRKSVRLINYTKGSGNLLIQFKEGGISAFFKMPLHELFEETISLDQLTPQKIVSQLEDQLASANDHLQRITIVEAFLLKQLSNAKRDDLINAALQQIHLHNGNIKMKALATALFISQDAFEKRFRKVVGTTPKQFASLVRMQTAIQQKSQAYSFTETAYEGGYFDQAHFNKEFKLFTGLTPSEFFRIKPLW